MSNLSSQPDATAVVPVLLIAEQERIHAALEPLLAQAMPRARLTWVGQCAQALELAHELAPVLILVDYDLLHDDPLRLIRQLSQELPETAVLALIEEVNSVEERRALQVGARAVLHKPVQAEELQSKLAQIPLHIASPVSTPAPEISVGEGESRAAGAGVDGETPADGPDDGGPAPARDGRLIAVVGTKGGTGKTTLLVNLAVALRELTGEAVAVVDAHFSAPAVDLALNLLEGPTWRDAAAALDHAGADDTDADDTDADDTDAELPDGLLTVHATGIHVLPAPIPAADPLQPAQAQVARVLAAVRRRYAWVVVDVGDPYGAAARAVLDQADRVLVVATPELTGLRNTRALLGSLAQRHGSPGKVWLVLNRADMPGGLRRTDIEERLQLRVRHVLPDDAPPARLSLNRGVPLLVSDPQCALSLALVELAQELCAELDGARGLRPLALRPRRGLARFWARLWGA